MVDGYRVLFLVGISAAEDLVDDVALICHEEKSLGILIETSDRVDPLWVI